MQTMNWEQISAYAAGVATVITGMVVAVKKVISGKGPSPGERLARIEGELSGLRDQVGDLQQRMGQIDRNLLEILLQMQKGF